ncbi:D-alanine--D-alanine ligase family protein [Miniphocaeibacter massiliensis]|uniref:D-alanine--D-alanine ligase family protein n=1 Tax=Miniphocaeibacter massiliensis TaxID=2041841 RepID=UPI000C1C42E8|nr:D-alanine--D-alanine ligase family protein [Miniphocaeibacter massiliensis]
MKKKILIIFGGNSTEYKVSLQSAYSILTNIDTKKFEPISIGITESGQWYLYKGDYENILNDKWINDYDNLIKVILVPKKDCQCKLLVLNSNPLSFDIAFPVIHGKNGEDGTIQGLFEIYKIPYIGCNVISSALCMDKYISHAVVKNFSIKIPKGFKVTKNYNFSDILNKSRKLNYPQYIKPINGGSSIGISKINNETKLEKALNEAFKYDNEIIVEENIEGTEVGCSIIGKENLITGVIDEINSSGHFFNYDEKYSDSDVIIHTPAKFSKELHEEIKETALKIYKALKCSGFARVDMFLTPSNEIIFNEVNTIPGLTPNSRFPRMMKFNGISFKELITKIIEVN